MMNEIVPGLRIVIEIYIEIYIDSGGVLNWYYYQWYVYYA